MDIENLKNNPEQVKLLIDLLSSLLPDNSQASTEAPKTKKRQDATTEPKSKIKTARGKARASSKNKFDQMPERNAHKEDVEIDKKLLRHPPTERSRTFAHIKLRCRCCGKEEKVSPGYVLETDRYKCNKCSISAG